MWCDGIFDDFGEEWADQIQTSADENSYEENLSICSHDIN